MTSALPYARRLVLARIDEDLVRPPFVKPFLKLGELVGMAAYFMQLGALLASLHREHLEAFGEAFLGSSSLAVLAETLVEIDAVLTESMSFTDFVCAEQSRQRGFDGSTEGFLAAFKSKKVFADEAEDRSMRFAWYGAALGAMRPDTAVRVFANTHAPATHRGSELTDRDRVAFDLVAKSESEIFRAYCRQTMPDLFEALIDKPSFQISRLSDDNLQ
jgi:hypothetical protein